ncbi:hypothetical protein AOX63_19135 [Pseudomonas sp. ADP]|nr:hypothetical protein AOX63_19135 [Pseudomonas sp. ADP]OBP12304.1 hypothetical protein BAE52_04855 [Pseudomonas sp. EGD-AKN5]
MHQAKEAIFNLRRLHARELGQFRESDLYLTKLIRAREQNRKKQTITDAQPPTTTWRRMPLLFRLLRSHLPPSFFVFFVLLALFVLFVLFVLLALFVLLVLFVLFVTLIRLTSEHRKSHVRAREQHLQQLGMLRVGVIPYQCVHMTRT